ncbi:MAG: dihydrolipoamide acetyltransferase family protein [Anaerolineales bacterium]
MATAVVMPKQGNTVESCLILQWHKSIGDEVAEGETLCDAETDKAVLEIPSPASGKLLEIFHQAGDEVPVFTNIAVIGESGEDVSAFRPDSPGEVTPESTIPETSVGLTSDLNNGNGEADLGYQESAQPGQSGVFISPRARKLAARKEIDIFQLNGSGPGGRVIERDVQSALEARKPISPVAKSMLEGGNFTAPVEGSGPRGRIMSKDLIHGAVQTGSGIAGPAPAGKRKTIPIRGMRRLIAERMLHSLQTTAQLTLNASADARSLIAYRKQLKESPQERGLRDVTINDLILFVVSRILVDHPQLNAVVEDDSIYQYEQVHLGVAVDTPRGLVVPVIFSANQKSLVQISEEARRQAQACVNGDINPDQLSGGTFTVTNLGGLGIESFTPILNPPQVGILGVGNINLKPVDSGGEVTFIPYLGLSLTINHQVVDGAPAARFLGAIAQGIADVQLLLAY